MVHHELSKFKRETAFVPAELSLAWEEINLHALNYRNHLFKKKEVTRTKILHDVSGIAKAGKLCAIMGPSGSGKTSLLSVLGQRNSGIIDGEVLLNGQPVSKETLVQMSCFVPQKDLAIKTLTVQEHLIFMANLMMDKRTSEQKRQNIIDGLCDEFNLTYCLKRKLSELSGGEMKRVSLAAQMMSDPPILFCDEPTTGLDSFSASQIVDLLRIFATEGKVVIASIHQPASGIFEMFDSVCLLTSGGKQAYFGDVADAKAHFSRMGFELPKSFNTADFMLSKLSTDSDALYKKFAQSETCKQLLDEIEDLSMNSNPDDGINQVFLEAYDFESPSSFAQLRCLAWRSVIDLYRNFTMVIVQVSLYAFTALLISIPVTDTTFNQVGIQNIQGRNYSVVIETGFTQTYTVLNTFPAEIPVVLREIGNGLYKPAPYFIARLSILIVRTIIEALIFAGIIYVVSGASSDISFDKFVFPVVLCAVTSMAYGCCISAMFENISVAMQLMNPIDFVSYICAGFFYKLNAAPIYMSWLKYISRFYYGYEAMTIIQWTGVESITCSENKNLPCINSGQGVINEYGYHSSNLPLDILGLVVMFFIMNTIGFLFLMKRSNKAASY